MRLIEIPDDCIVRIPIMSGEDTVGERRIDLSYMPTIEIEQVRHGRWENTGEYYERGRTSTQYRCSECGRRAGYKQVKLYHYCPNCGAKMDGDKYAN